MIKYVFSDKPLTILNADGADPQKIGTALNEITNANGGRLEPEKIVEAAKKDRRLHPHFEWNDRKAAHSYRLEQARELVRVIHVEHEESESGVARAWLSIHDKAGTAYRTIGEVLNSHDLQQRLLSRAEADLLAWESRYKSLQEVCALVRVARERLSERRTGNRGRGEEARV